MVSLSEMDKLDFHLLPIAWRIGETTVTPFGIVAAISLILYLFLVWIALSKDHDQEDVVRLSLGTVLAFFIGGRLINIFLNINDYGFDINNWLNLRNIGKINFLGGLVSMIAYMSVVYRSFHLSIWYFLEKLVFPVSIIALLINLSLFLTTAEVAFLGKGVIFIIILISSLFLSGYRSFVWYGSGKAGFLFFAVTGEYFFLAIILDFILSAFSYWQLVLNVVLLLASLMGVYFLSGKKVKKGVN